MLTCNVPNYFTLTHMNMQSSLKTLGKVVKKKTVKFCHDVFLKVIHKLL